MLAYKGPVWKPVVFTIVGVVSIAAVLALVWIVQSRARETSWASRWTGRRSHTSRPNEVVPKTYFRNSYERRDASLQINQVRFAQEWEEESADLAKARALAGEPPIDDGASLLATYAEAAERKNQSYLDIQLGLPKYPPTVARVNNV